MLCHCGSTLPFDRCCGPILDGAPAPTAEALMRSRYSAHVTGHIDYLLATHDASTRSGFDRRAVERWARESSWLGLEIVARERGGPADADGVVEFKARYRVDGGQPLVHHERSRFRRREGRWFYVDGDTIKPPPARAGQAPGRNDPCPCGSGHKYKRCCGR